jgi:hypothetical protein
MFVRVEKTKKGAGHTIEWVVDVLIAPKNGRNFNEVSLMFSVCQSAILISQVCVSRRAPYQALSREAATPWKTQSR